MGNEKMISGSHHRRYGSQPISVPFLWEQKPGMPKREWIAKPISSVSAKSSEEKPVSSGEKAIVPLKLVISVPFQWEEKPGKPILMEENTYPTILPVAFSSCNPSINEAEKVFDSFAFDMHHDSFSSSDQNYSSFHGSSNEGDSNQNESWCSAFERDILSDSNSTEMRYELEVKSCTSNRSHLVKRSLTLGELILLSRKLSYPKKASFVRKHGFFSMEIIRRSPFACFPFGTNHQKKQCVPQK